MDNNDMNKSVPDSKWDRLTKVCTKKRLCGLVAVIAAAGIIGGGIDYYHHQQVRTMHAQERAAMSQLNTIKADKMGLSLLSEAEIRSIVADSLGQDETSITFDEIDLSDGQQMSGPRDKKEKRDKHGKESKHAHKDKRDQEHRPAAPEQDEHMAGPEQADPQTPAPEGFPGHPGHEQGAPQFAGAPGQHRFAPGNGAENAPAAAPAENAQPGADGQRGQRPGRQPHFNYLVRCTVNGMHYTVVVDALSGQVLHQDVRAAH